MVTLRQPYREKVSQMVSWGHWFALFNMLLAMVLGSRYLFVADWPTTLAGRLFSYVSLVGHFSFLVFTSYVLILFPLTFIVVSQRLMRFLSVILATAGMTLLLIDSEGFTRFHLHLNPVVWELVINPDQNEMARDWQLMFISVPVIFLIEMLFATWSWQKLRSLTRRRHYARPVAWFFFLSFVSSHLVYIWADANFYRPITMQRANLPLSYPMTARRFLEKHGLLDAQDYQRRLVEQGAPEAVSVQYPLSNLRYRDLGAGYNVLLITVDNLNYSRFEKTMPALAAFAKENVNFTQHMSSGNTADSGLFGLFYGISPGYMDGVLSARIPAALITALNQQGYQLGLFSSDGFSSPLYRQALLSDFSLPSAKTQSDLRAMLGYVPQKGVLFTGDILSNLEFAGDVSEADAIRAAATAQAEDFIWSRPQHFLTPVAQGGSNVSGGQRQRLSIARAIAKHPQVYLFDDSFSALDYQTDAALRQALARQTHDATVLIVAQRLSTILHADQILVLDGGRIVGCGTHSDLLRGCETYREIALSQLSAAELGQEG